MKPTEKERRAGIILQALKTQYGMGDPIHRDELASAICDALSDLRHLCDVTDEDYFALDRQAYTHYIAEQHEMVPEGEVIPPEAKNLLQMVAKVKLAEGA